MNPVLLYFNQAITLISAKAVLPYYLDVKVKELSDFLSQQEKTTLIKRILFLDNSSECFRYFSKRKALQSIFYYLDILKKIPQNKGRSKNAFDHTLRVLDQVPIEDGTLRWVAIFHDLGKYDAHRVDHHFRNHQAYSYEITKILCEVYDVPNKKKVVNLVKNHMFPLDYQRNPNWTEKAIMRFIDRVGREDVLDSIRFSYFDKKAENDVLEYLEIIQQFFKKVESILNGKK